MAGDQLAAQADRVLAEVDLGLSAGRAGGFAG
jgi:hypothetical protein